MDTLEARVKGLTKELRARGIHVRRNVMSCCRSCADINSAEGQSVFWTFGGQGSAVYIKGDEAYARAYDSWSGRNDPCIADPVYWNHDGLVEDGKLTDDGHAVVDGLRRYGIHFEWDYSEGRCIEVDFDKSTIAANEERAKHQLVDTMLFV